MTDREQALREENDLLLKAIKVLQEEQQEVEHIEQCRIGRVSRAGNSLILNLESLNNDTLMFFAELEHFPDPTRRAVLRQLKQHHDILTSQFNLHNLPL